MTFLDFPQNNPNFSNNFPHFSYNFPENFPFFSHNFLQLSFDDFFHNIPRFFFISFLTISQFVVDISGKPKSLNEFNLLDIFDYWKIFQYKYSFVSYIPNLPPVQIITIICI